MFLEKIVFFNGVKKIMRRIKMEIRIEKWQVEKMLTKLIPPMVFEGQEISRIEAHYDGSMSIHLSEIEEEGKEE